jgi:fucose 4-O-acetylase-like acetyltransferase
MSTEKIQIPNRLDFLDNIKAIAIFMVVAVHAAAYIPQLTDSQRLVISAVFHSVAVPIFFMVDGFLFAKTREGKSSFSYFDYIKKSAHRLVLPWIIFTLVYALMRYALEQLNFFNDHYILGKSFFDLAKSAYGAVYSAQLYFLLSLFFIRLATPVICKLLQTINGVGWFFVYLFFVFLYQFFGQGIREYLYIEGGQEPLTHAIWGVQYYVFGIFLYKLLSKINFLMFLSAIACMILFGFLQNYLSFSIYEPERMLYMFSIFLFCYLYGKYFRFISDFGRQSMGIYLLHVPLILKVLSMTLYSLGFLPIIQFFMLAITGFIVSYCLTLLINKIGLGGILLGSR